MTFTKLALPLAVAVALNACQTTPNPEPPTSAAMNTQVISSPGQAGEKATLVTFNGLSKTFNSSIPVSISPDGTKALLHETGADDDLKHFVVSQKNGKLVRGPKIGGRWTTSAKWAADSKSITFTNNPDLATSPTETVVVE